MLQSEGTLRSFHDVVCRISVLANSWLTYPKFPDSIRKWHEVGLAVLTRSGTAKALFGKLVFVAGVDAGGGLLPELPPDKDPHREGVLFDPRALHA